MEIKQENIEKQNIRDRLDTAYQKISDKLSFILDPVKHRTLKKRYTGEALTKEEYTIVVENDLGFEGFTINVYSLLAERKYLDNPIENTIKNRNFLGAIFDIKGWKGSDYKFENCRFSDCSFKNLQLNSVIFEGCDFYNINFSNLKLPILSFKKCNIEVIDIEKLSINNDFYFLDCQVFYIVRPFDKGDIQQYFSENSPIKKSIKTKKSKNGIPSIDFENEIQPHDNKKTNKIGTIIVNDGKEKKELKAFFRRSKDLLSVVFLENYQVGNSFLQKNIIYTLDNIRHKDKSNNEISDEQIIEKNYLRYDIWSQLNSMENNFPQDENGHLIIDTTDGCYENELIFKMVRPISTEFNNFKENFENELERLNYFGD